MECKEVFELGSIYHLPELETDDQLRQLLKARAEKVRLDRQALLEERERLDARLKEIAEYIETLDPFLIKEGLQPVNDDHGDSVRHPVVGAVGNRSEKMPPRRPVFKDSTLNEAIAAVLRSGAELHADVIAAQIYAVRDHTDVTYVKRSLVSSLSRGAAAGLWERAGKPNTFRGKSGQLTNAVLEPALNAVRRVLS